MEKNPSATNGSNMTVKPKKKRKWLRITLVILAIVLFVGGVLAFKAGTILNKISTNGGILTSITKSLPGVKNELKGQAEGRINIALLGMRGENIPGGGLLADTIMVVSLKPAENKVSFVSIPRDLTVQVPNNNFQSKINAVHFYGEDQAGRGGGLEYMKQVLGEVTGIPIHYAMSINFKGFQDLVDALGGITVTLNEPFMEGLQFHEPHVCDSFVFTKPALNEKGQQMYECKYSKQPRDSMLYTPTWDPYPLCQNKPKKTGGVFKIMVQYPLCYNENEECGGIFKLEAGNNQLDGKNALCYARARFSSNDFERAARQQVVIEAIRQKALSAGTLTDFDKIMGVVDSLGDNVRTDMQAWEMKEFYALYGQMSEPQRISKVLQNSEEGLLYAAEQTKELGYHLLPIGDNYDRIHELFRNIFSQ